jgi:hypothetical protein
VRYFDCSHCSNDRLCFYWAAVMSDFVNKKRDDDGGRLSKVDEVKVLLFVEMEDCIPFFLKEWKDIY